MDYALLIEERKSTRAFKGKAVPGDVVSAIKSYHDNECMRLFPDIKTECFIADSQAKEALEGAAGYKEFLIGAPSYFVLLSEPHENSVINAGYITEDISLKLAEMGYGSCFVTFTDKDAIKSVLDLDSDLEVSAILAFGIGERKRKKMHFNVFTMSNITAKEKQQYFSPKKDIEDLVYIDEFGNSEGVHEKIDYYGDVLWESLLAASNSPSYMNRQPYAFVIKDNKAVLVRLPDEFTGPIDNDLNIGVVMQQFAAVASSMRGNAVWDMAADEVGSLPDGAEVMASFVI